jgi:hypothetical protein
MAPVADLVGRFGDRRGDPALAQVGAVGSEAVCLLGQDPVRAGPGPTGRLSGDSNAVVSGGEVGAA